MAKYSFNYDLLNEINNRETAKKYFPDFFGAGFNILKKSTLSNLQNKYMQLRVRYFTFVGKEYDRIRSDINRSYKFLNMIINARDNFGEEDNNIQDFLQLYNQLIAYIRAYRFNKKYEISSSKLTVKKTYGSQQDNANAMALDLIQDFGCFANGVLIVLEKCFKDYKKPEEVDASYCILKDFFKFWIDNFKRCITNLRQTQDDYHITLDFANGRTYKYDDFDFYSWHWTNYYDLGTAKKRWRQAKNDACNTLLYFWESLFGLYMALLNNKLIPSNDPTVATDEEIIREYQENMELLRKSPVYFCFLDASQKEELTRLKRIRRRTDKSPIVELKDIK